MFQVTALCQSRVLSAYSLGKFVTIKSEVNLAKPHPPTPTLITKLMFAGANV